MDAQELIERVMTEHWDFYACSCSFCCNARKLGYRPRTGYPTGRRGLLNCRASIDDMWHRGEKNDEKELELPT